MAICRLNHGDGEKYLIHPTGRSPCVCFIRRPQKKPSSSPFKSNSIHGGDGGGTAAMECNRREGKGKGESTMVEEEAWEELGTPAELKTDQGRSAAGPGALCGRIKTDCERRFEIIQELCSSANARRRKSRHKSGGRGGREEGAELFGRGRWEENVRVDLITAVNCHGGESLISAVRLIIQH